MVVRRNKQISFNYILKVNFFPFQLTTEPKQEVPKKAAPTETPKLKKLKKREDEKESEVSFVLFLI